MRHIHYFLLFFVAIALVSCGNRAELKRMQGEMDSLKTVNQKIMKDNNMMSSFVNTFSEGIDSIFTQEKLINTGKDEDGHVLTRKQIKEKINSLAAYISQQREKITELENQLNVDSVNSKFGNVVRFLKSQLSRKESELLKVQGQLSTANGTIKILTEQNETLTGDNSNLKVQIDDQKNVIEGQTEALAEQTNMLNEGYVIIGSKKELKAMGVLEKANIFSKTKVNSNNIKTGSVMKVDIREFKEITLNSKKPKILSHMPSGSYQMSESGNSTILKINDAMAFWSVSSVLIIQL